MEIIDAQIHPPLPVVPLGDEYSEETKLLLSVELAREAIDSTGVDKAVVFADQAFNEACVARYPDLFAGVLVFNHAAGDLEERIIKFKQQPGMLAARCLPTNYGAVRSNPDIALQINETFKAGGFDQYWALCEKYELPLFFSAHNFASALSVVAERHPNLTIIVDHFGITQSLPAPKTGDQWTALPGLLSLAKYPNVYVKCCGTPVVSDQDFPYEDIWPHFHKILKAFGPERCMWASDYTRMRWGVAYRPGARGHPPREDWKSYADCLHYLLHTNEISQSDKEHLFSKTVRRALRWEH